MKNTALSALLVLVGCRMFAPNSETKDLETDINQNGATYLYYVRDGKLIRGLCESSERSQTRENCQGELTEVSYPEFMRRLHVGVGADLETHQTEVTEIFAQILNIDTQLAAFVQISDTPDSRAKKQEIDDHEIDIAEVLDEINSIDGEIFEIRRHLTDIPDDDLERQLAELESLRLRKMKSQNTAKEKLRMAYEEYIDMRSEVSDAETVSDLELLKTDFEVELAGKKELLQAELDEMIQFSRVRRFLQDPTFSYPVMQSRQAFEGVKPHVEKMNEVFNVMAMERLSESPEFELTASFAQLPSVDIRGRAKVDFPADTIEITVGGQKHEIPYLENEFVIPMPANYQACGVHTVKIRIHGRLQNGGNWSSPSEERTFEIKCWQDEPALADVHTVYETDREHVSRVVVGKLENPPSWAKYIRYKYTDGVFDRLVQGEEEIAQLGGRDLTIPHPTVWGSALDLEVWYMNADRMFSGPRKKMRIWRQPFAFENSLDWGRTELDPIQVKLRCESENADLFRARIDSGSNVPQWRSDKIGLTFLFTNAGQYTHMSPPSLSAWGSQRGRKDDYAEAESAIVWVSFYGSSHGLATTEHINPKEVEGDCFAEGGKTLTFRQWEYHCPLQHCDR